MTTSHVATLATVVEDLERFAAVMSHQFKKQAYLAAAETFRQLSDQEVDGMSVDELMTLPKVGKATARIVFDILTTGQSEKIESAALPRGCNFLKLRGVGPVKARKLIEKYAVQTIEELRDVLPETEKKLIAAVDFYMNSVDRRPWFLVSSMVYEVINLLAEHGIESSAAGSYRRFVSTVGDLDFVVRSTTVARVQEILESAIPKFRVESAGEEKLLCTLPLPDDSLIHADFVCPADEDYGATLNYLTGNRDFNVDMRRLAKSVGLKLNEHGLFADNEKTSIPAEEDLFTTLQVPYVAPPKRSWPLTEAISRNFLTDTDPVLSMHNHTTFSDGTQSPSEVVNELRQRGCQLIGFSDHSKPAVAGVRDFKEYRDACWPLRAPDVLLGIEAEILKAGLPQDLENQIVGQLDYAILSCHVAHDVNVLSRLEDAIRRLAPMPVILAHITGRILGYRAGADIRSLESLRKYDNVIIEINAHLNRLDPPARLLRTWDGPVVISTDAHEKAHYDNYTQGLWQSWKGGVVREQLGMAYELLVDRRIGL